eukprot:6171985-Prymnesium_polylepis.1
MLGLKRKPPFPPSDKRRERARCVHDRDVDLIVSNLDAYKAQLEREGDHPLRHARAAEHAVD